MSTTPSVVGGLRRSGVRVWVWRPASVAILSLAAAGCTVTPSRDSGWAGAADPLCVSFVRDLDDAIARDTHFDPALGRIEGLPWVRTNRFLAGFDYNRLDAAEQQAWLASGFALAREAYQVEFVRLSEESRAALRTRHGFETPGSRLDACFSTLQAPHALTPETYAVPDGYRRSLRVLGLYPVTSLLARPFIASYRSGMTDLYADGASAMFDREVRYRGQGGEYQPSDADIAMDALGVPQPSREQWHALFMRHQPEFDAPDLLEELGITIR